MIILLSVFFIQNNIKNEDKHLIAFGCSGIFILTFDFPYYETTRAKDSNFHFDSLNVIQESKYNNIGFSFGFHQAKLS